MLTPLALPLYPLPHLPPTNTPWELIHIAGGQFLMALLLRSQLKLNNGFIHVTCVKDYDSKTPIALPWPYKPTF